VYNSAVLLWFPESYLCSLWRKVTARCDKGISSELRHTASLPLYDASTSQHVIDAGGVGEYFNQFYCNNGFLLFPYILCCRPIMEFSDKNFLAFYFLLLEYKSDFPLASVNVMDAQSACRQARAQ
jgi:hypothetical protein